MKNLIVSIISITLLSNCNQSNINRQSINKEQVNDTVEKTVSLSIKPNVFKLSHIPDTVKVVMSNNTHDTIMTGLHYKIENLENKEWKEASPNDVMFNDLGWQLNPTNSGNFDKTLYKDRIKYEAGRYRIVKYYVKSDYQKSKQKITVFAEFEVK
ncbi:immunoglobulin-like domain-containing protein [Sphingobacterium corticis]|uniref:Immunoglobulin-like domain-containing protein n=1 Tax=Sphingobacterium corticis TaxID=1812823 RepID=A0ABW5NGF5_9SPHI